MANQDMPEISGGELTGLKARGRTFDLWVNAVDGNAQLMPNERLPAEMAARVQHAARLAAAAAGVDPKRIEAVEFIALYPEARQKDLREQSLKGLRCYIEHAPDPGTVFKWRLWLGSYDARAAAERAALKAAIKPAEDDPALQAIADATGQKAVGRKQKAGTAKARKKKTAAPPAQ